MSQKEVESAGQAVPVTAGPTAPSVAPLFAFMWAVSHGLHAWHKGGADLSSPLSNPWLVAVLLASAWVLSRPSSRVRLATLAAVQLGAYAVEYPFVANHWTISAFVNAGILISFFSAGVAREGTVHGLVRDLAPHARAALILSYGAAAIAKLNSTFFNPEFSCAVALLEPIAEWLQFDVPGSGVRPVMIGLVAATELSIPVLLLVPRTRNLGIVVALVFHFLLAVSPVVLVADFTTLIYALLVFFAPGDLGERLGREWSNARPRYPRAAAWSGRRGAGPIVLLVLLATAIGRGWLLGPTLWTFLTWMTFLLYQAMVVTMGIGVLASYGLLRRATFLAHDSRLRPSHALLLILLLLNASAPYVGLKTTSSFTMFSNLRTEGGETNHFFLPRLPWFGYQEDLVRVVWSSHPALLEIASADAFLTNHEFRRLVGDSRDVQMIFERGGRRYDTRSGGTVIPPLDPLEAKLLHFRSISIDGFPRCQA